VRIHAFELCDVAPLFWRQAETRYLAVAIALTRPFDRFADDIAALAGPERRVVDLGSGDGGPWPALAAKAGVDVVLTDLRPTRAGVRAVDARAVPAELTGLRTMFDAFHHLRPVEARAVLADAARARTPILIAEALSRRTILATLLVPLFVLLLVPRIRPVSPWILVFTYLVPLLPLMIFWDAMISSLRAYTPRELRAMVEGIEDMAWEIGRRGAVSYLIGRPLVADRDG